MSFDPIAALEACRQAEKEQALYYRALAAEAEAQSEPELSERFQGLHADEQHHLSRLTARLTELGAHPADLSGVRALPGRLQDWEPLTRRREKDEVRRYEILLEQDLDADTAALVKEILEVERRHSEELGGKWTMA